MTRNESKGNTTLVVIAVIGAIGTVLAATIGAITTYNVEKLRQSAELTQIAVVSIATQGGATNIALESTINAPTQAPYPTYTQSSSVPNSPPTATITIPTPTKLRDTPTGTILNDGETWRQGGSELTLTDFIFRPRSNPDDAQIFTSWTYKNISSQDIVLTFSHTNFTAQSNLGNQLKTLKFYAYGVSGFYCDDISIVVKSNKVFDFFDMCGPGSTGYKLPIVVDLGNKQITEVVITVKDISSITNAKWKISISH